MFANRRIRGTALSRTLYDDFHITSFSIFLITSKWSSSSGRKEDSNTWHLVSRCNVGQRPDGVGQPVEEGGEQVPLPLAQVTNLLVGVHATRHEIKARSEELVHSLAYDRLLRLEG